MSDCVRSHSLSMIVSDDECNRSNGSHSAWHELSIRWYISTYPLRNRSDLTLIRVARTHTNVPNVTCFHYIVQGLHRFFDWRSIIKSVAYLLSIIVSSRRTSSTYIATRRCTPAASAASWLSRSQNMLREVELESATVNYSRWVREDKLCDSTPFG